MTARSPGAFMLSATFHATIVGLVFLYAIAADRGDKIAPRVLELVAGEGDNFAATEAPALGSPTALKLNVPKIPVPIAIPEPVAEPEPLPPEPVKPAPKPAPPPPKAPAKKAEPVVPDFKKQIQRKVWAADWRAKQQIKKERAAEQKRLQKAEFDRQQKAKAAAASKRSSTPKVAHVDTEGIKKGVIGGSTANKIGGAGGKALVREDGPVMDAYWAMLVQRVQNALDKPPGLSDDLAVTVVFRIAANGRLSGARVVNSSGSEDFDRAVIAAFSRVEMPKHPQNKSEQLELTFRTKDIEGG